MDLYQALKLAALAIAGLVCLSLYRRRDALFVSAQRLCVAGLIFAYVPDFYLWREKAGLRFLVAWAVAIVADTLLFPPRSRNIPESVRQEAIRRFEARTGQQFDPAIHELDHHIAFVRGGSTTVDNVRVMERGANRSKGATTPWWDILGHLQGDSETPLQALMKRFGPRDQTQSTPDTKGAAPHDPGDGWADDDPQLRLGLK